MSRARRRPRHRRPPRLARTAAPVVLGGALAALAVSATPLGDALRSPGPERREAGGSDRPATGVLYLAPSGTGTPTREVGSGSGGPAGSGDRQVDAGDDDHADQADPANDLDQAADGAAVQPVSDGPASAPGRGTPGDPAPVEPAPPPAPPGTPPPDPVLPVPLPTPTPTATPLPPLLPALPVPLPTLSPLLP